jgi:hypothetical protein
MEIKKGNAPPVYDNIFTCLYGDPGNRKTSFACTAENPLLLDYDMRGHRAYGAENVDRVDVKNFDEVIEASQKYNKKYKTLIIDTVGRLLDQKILEIIGVSKSTPSLKAHNPFGGLSLPGYGILKSAFSDATFALRRSGMDVVFVAHGKRTKEGENTSWEPDIVGSSSDEIYKMCDLLGLIAPVAGRTAFRLNPSEMWQAKNPLGLGTVLIDKKGEPGWDITLKELVDKCRVKAGETAKPADNEEVKAIMEKIAACTTVDQSNQLIKEMKSIQSETIKDMARTAFKKRREELGFSYSEQKGVYK